MEKGMEVRTIRNGDDCCGDGVGTMPKCGVCVDIEGMTFAEIVVGGDKCHPHAAV